LRFIGHSLGLFTDNYVVVQNDWSCDDASSKRDLHEKSSR
jgi:hypothetical protein